MGKVAVQSLLKKIGALPEQDRELLEERLAQQVQTQWEAEAKKARRSAKRKGIDQTSIDRALEEARYGR